ncbi:hypothetical protein ABID92_000444 [Frigoribacterium sp. PvP120]|uniref:hypothetical protein n=1 Tax=unclassified Frigoribacterium TaxID=2627005 RepID=UPI001AEA0B17|nr:hypothetical protein [Frigoribacterium sp. PvP121]MBP1241728.1 hypothetical protein [Frigoribacterium sp. PvP121]
MIVLPRESIEIVLVPVHVDGTLVTAGVEVTTTTGDQRPTDWRPADLTDDRTGILVTGLPVGVHTVWVRVTSVPEVPVLQSGQIRIT